MNNTPLEPLIFLGVPLLNTTTKHLISKVKEQEKNRDVCLRFFCTAVIYIGLCYYLSTLSNTPLLHISHRFCLLSHFLVPFVPALKNHQQAV